MADWDIINGREVNLMKRPVEFTPEYGAADLGKLDTELSPRYVKKDKDGNLTVPLYFHELDVALKVLSFTIKTEDELRWFREYIRSFPAYMPPAARVNLIRGVFREIRTHNLDADPLFHDLLTLQSESCYSDWRSLVTSAKSKVLMDVYWYGVPMAQRATTPPNFQPTLGSLLDFKRHSCEHIEEKSRDKNRKQQMKWSIEAEVFTASKVMMFLPWLIKKLLEICNMDGHFRDVWESYKSSGFNYNLAIRKVRG